jgi:hypothetical protein
MTHKTCSHSVLSPCYFGPYVFSKNLHKGNFSFPKKPSQIGEKERVESKGCRWSDCIIRSRLRSVCSFILVYPLCHEAPSITSFVLVFSSDGCLCNVPWQQTKYWSMQSYGTFT